MQGEHYDRESESFLIENRKQKNFNIFSLICQEKSLISCKFFKFLCFSFIFISISCFAYSQSSDAGSLSDMSSDTKNAAAVRSRTIVLDYNIIAEFNAAPLIVSADRFALGLGGDIAFGVRFNERYGVGLMFDVGYETLGRDGSSGLSGAELAFRWTVFGSCTIAPFFEMAYQVGASLAFCSYQYQLGGYEPRTAAGIVLHVEPRFRIPQFRYIDFAVIADADLRLSEYFIPQVYGAARLNVHPYIEWLAIFVEAGVRYNRYEDASITLNSTEFVLSAGVSFDVYIRHKSKSEYSKDKNGDSPAVPGMTDNADDIADGKDSKAEPDILPEDETKKEYNQNQTEEQSHNDAPPAPSVHTTFVAEMDEATKAEYQELIDNLESQTGAKVVSFSDILFAPNSDEMIDGSETILDEVVRLLDENESMRLNICGYTNNVGNKKMELKTSKKRVNRVVNYLMMHGVDVFRLEVAAYGGENVKAAGINKVNRRVEIRVLEDKE